MAQRKAQKETVVAPVPTAIEQIREKLERANEHIANLHREIESFLDEAPERTLVNYDSEAAEAFKRFHKDRPIKLRFAVITGEVMYQLISCLDYLASALIRHDGGTTTNKSAFPIFIHEPLSKDHVARYQAKIKGITRKKVLAALKRAQPYQRIRQNLLPANHWLAILRDFNNRDKHSSLLLHVTVIQPRIHIETRSRNSFGGYTGDDDGTEPALSYTDPDGDLIEVVNVQRSLTTDISFEKWGDTGRDIGVVRGLLSLFTGVTEIINTFEPFLRPKRPRKS